MDVKHLQYFLAVAQFGTLGRAAKQLSVSQPAISKSIGRLEATLHARLFDRTSRGMVLTEFGLALVERAQFISNESRLIRESFDVLRGSGKGTLSVGCGSSHGSTIVPAAVLALRASRPNATFSITVGSSETLLNALKQGTVDVLVGALFANAWDRELASELIAYDRVVVVARPAHLLFANRPLALESMARASWVLGNTDDSLRAQLSDLFSKAGVTPPEPVYLTTSVPTIKSLLLLTDLLAFIPESLVTQELANGSLKKLEHEDLVWRRPVQVLYPLRRPLSRLGSALVQQLRLAVQDSPAYLPV